MFEMCAQIHFSILKFYASEQFLKSLLTQFSKRTVVIKKDTREIKYFKETVTLDSRETNTVSKRKQI